MVDYWRLLRTWQRFKSFRKKDPRQIEEYQLDRFISLIKHAYENVAMYREFYDSKSFDPGDVRSIKDLEHVPVITKEIMRNYSLEKRVTREALRHMGDIHKETTSGSTGEPFEIWSDHTESLIQALKGIRFLREWGYSPHYNTVQLWRADVQPKISVIQKLGLFRREIVSIMDQPDIVVSNMMRSKCDVLYATRSSLEILADELYKRGITIKPRIVVASSEVLTEKNRQLFRDIYGCETLEIYGSVESGNIAWGCPDNPLNLHIDIETVMVHYKGLVQANGAKKTGGIVVTNLENHIMPFIKYDLDDAVLLQESNICSCGRTSPLLGRVLGRNDDILEVNGRKFNFHYFYNYFKNYLYIKKYKILQNPLGEVEFRVQLVADSADSRAVCMNDLKAAFGEHFSPLNITFVDGFPVAANAKFKVIERIS